jgi:hypothetical protein
LCGRERREERGDSGRPHFFPLKKYVITHKQKTKLNSNCTIKFVSINPSKQDLTWIYLDKI